MIRRSFFSACAAAVLGVPALLKAEELVPEDKPLPGPVFRYYRVASTEPLTFEECHPITDIRFKITRVDLMNPDLKALPRRNG